MVGARSVPPITRGRDAASSCFPVIARPGLAGGVATGGGTVTTNLAEFSAARPRLHAVALRVLGDAGDAEDVVQETWLRWERADRSDVRSPRAFLAVTARRLAINAVLSAHRRQETPAGPWLPDTADRGAGADTLAERGDAVDAALRLLLERLTPAERATYLLRTAFDYPYRRIADVTRLSAANCRQLARRAHLALAAGRCRPVDAAAHRRLVRAFLGAARGGDLRRKIGRAHV